MGMGMFQPKVTPLPTGINLQGKTAIVTGASAGIGLEVSRQLLALNVSTLILAVRTLKKGEAVKEKFLMDKDIKRHNPKADIRVMQLDMDDYQSIKDFAAKFKTEVAQLDLLILNAGIGLLKLERSPSGHDRTTQVNYYSNVILTFELLSTLEATAARTGKPSRISWVGSRNHYSSTLEKKKPVKPNEGVIEHFDAQENFFPYQHYNDTKLLCAMFLYDIAKRISPDKVVINMMCPGMVDTSMSDVLPQPFRAIINLIKFFAARTPEEAGWIVVNAAAVVGPDSHGQFYGDKKIEP